MKLTGKNGVLRIYDSTDVLHDTAPRDDAVIDIVKLKSGTYYNETAFAKADDTDFITGFIDITASAIFIGSTVPFARIKYLKGHGTDYGAGTGALLAYYFNGTNFSTALTGVTDGTLSGGDTFAQDGIISFKTPADWAIGANSVSSDLDANKYYIKLAATTDSSAAPDADVLCPVDGQYYEVPFVGMDFSGPIGRPLTDEMLVLNRGNMDAFGHYIEGPDNPIYEPVSVSFSAMLDSTYNKTALQAALSCGDPDSARWTAAGTTAKGTTKNDGTNFNPAFVDTSKKAINLLVRWYDTGLPFGMAYYETFFPPEGITIQESEEGIVVSVQGGCYGVIEDINHLCNRY